MQLESEKANVRCKTPLLFARHVAMGTSVLTEDQPTHRHDSKSTNGAILVIARFLCLARAGKNRDIMVSQDGYTGGGLRLVDVLDDSHSCGTNAFQISCGGFVVDRFDGFARRRCISSAKIFWIEHSRCAKIYCSGSTGARRAQQMPVVPETVQRC